MPIKKFRDVSEMESDVWYEPGDPRLFDAIRAVWTLAARTMKPRFPAGVYRHRSIESANELQQSWDRTNFEAFHARRRQARSG